MKNILVVQKIRKQKTLNHVQFSYDFNNKVDLILKKTELFEKNKNKIIDNEWEDNKEYYENFLIKLKADRKKSHGLLKTNLKVDRKKKYQTINLNDIEKTKVKSTISNNKKSLLHSFLRKSLIFSSKKNSKTSVENKIENLQKIIKNPSLKIVSNVQFFIKSPNQIKTTFSHFKIEKKKKNKSPNNKINSLVNKINPFEKEFGILNDNYRLSTFCNMELDEKKREKITKSIFDSIIPVKDNFISNATKIEFKKNCDNTIDNNIKIIDEENKNNNLIEERSIKNENVFIYTIKDESNKKKKLNICCCIPIKI